VSEPNHLWRGAEPNHEVREIRVFRHNDLSGYPKCLKNAQVGFAIPAKIADMGGFDPPTLLNPRCHRWRELSVNHDSHAATCALANLRAA